MKVSGDLLNKWSMCQSIQDNLEKRLAIASIITEAFNENNLPPPIMVGGAAVATYTGGEYGTYDTDFIANLDGQEYEVVSMLGYKRVGKDCYNAALDSLIEFPSGDLDGSRERIFKYEVDSTGLPTYLISLEDLILDRTSSFVSTNDENSKEWALRLMTATYEYLEWSYLHKEAHKRGFLEVVERLQREVKRTRKLYKEMREELSITKHQGMRLL